MKYYYDLRQPFTQRIKLLYMVRAKSIFSNIALNLDTTLLIPAFFQILNCVNNSKYIYLDIFFYICSFKICQDFCHYVISFLHGMTRGIQR